MGWIGVLMEVKRERLVVNRGRPVKSLEQLRRIEWREQPGQDYTDRRERKIVSSYIYSPVFELHGFPHLH